MKSCDILVYHTKKRKPDEKQRMLEAGYSDLPGMKVVDKDVIWSHGRDLAWMRPGRFMLFHERDNCILPKEGRMHYHTEGKLQNTWHTTWITNTSVNSQSLIRTVYSSPYVITRDRVPNLK